MPLIPLLNRDRKGFVRQFLIQGVNFFVKVPYSLNGDSCTSISW